MFKDTNIYPVVYYEEKQILPEFGDDQGETTESCDFCVFKCFPTSVWEEQDEDNHSLSSASFQMKMKLLDECVSAEDDHDNPDCQSEAALQRHSNDETYVTMSSLYKTQWDGENKRQVNIWLLAAHFVNQAAFILMMSCQLVIVYQKADK